MAITPSTTVHLLSVPFENDYKNVVYWESKAAQTSGMLNRKKHTFNDFTYQRKDSVIRIPAHIDTIEDCNYVMYLNASHTNKWFYAFIIKKEYVNDSVTAVYIETDVYNTYCFDVRVLQSFVEREHCADDTIGSNTIPEGLELGEYISSLFRPDPLSGGNEKYIVIASTSTPGGDDVVCGTYGGIFSGVGYFMYKTPEAASAAIKLLSDAGKDEGIQSIFMCPDWMFNDDAEDGSIGWSNEVYTYDKTLDTRPDEGDVLGESYIPLNNKLFTYPYCFHLVSNNNGSDAVYHYELFDKNSDIKFRTVGAITPGCSIRCYPLNYAGQPENYDAGINLNKIPICNWNTDAYTNWMTQNAISVNSSGAAAVVNAATSIFNGALQGILTGAVGGTPGMVAGGIAGGVTGGISGATQIASVIGEVEKRKIMPPQSSGNINCGDVSYSLGRTMFCHYRMSIKDEYARIIDDYFHKYGYKTNKVKTPNKAHRSTFWYTKTIDVCINGDVPANDMAKFKDIYNKGVTFWRDMATVEDYSSTNRIVEV